MKAIDDYRGEHVVVLGMAKSGAAVAKRLLQAGALVTVNDQKTREQCLEADTLESLGVRVICGGHPADLIHDQVRLVVKNPGIPYQAEPVQAALSKGIEVVTEVEVASRDTQIPIIGITGSNGKTTTTTLIGLMLEKANLQPMVCGNIGKPFCDAVAEANATQDNPQAAIQWFVSELSSFQLKGTQTFRPKIALLTNLYETHLDYHGDMEDYAESKWQLFSRQTQDDIAILHKGHEITNQWIERGVPGQLWLFSALEAVERGVGVENGDLVAFHVAGQEKMRIIALDEIGIPGQHNAENAAAAAAVALAAGASVDAIAAVLSEFRGVEHRLEFVREYQGVKVFNDSKATNPQASIRAIVSFEQPIVLVAGGLDRGSDYKELIPYFQKHLKGLVAFGQTASKLKAVAEAAGVSKIAIIERSEGQELDEMVQKAVRTAMEMTEQGNVLLLSPACASWDQFPSYEVRGRMFKAAVHML